MYIIHDVHKNAHCQHQITLTHPTTYKLSIAMPTYSRVDMYYQNATLGQIEDLAISTKQGKPSKLMGGLS